MSSKFLQLCKNSKIEKEFDRILDNNEIKVISFDIFETLVFRKVAHHNDIFYKVGKNDFVKNIYNTAEAFQMYRLSAQRAARLKFLEKNEITFDEIYNELDLTYNQKEKIKNIELEQEYKSLYINKQISNWIKRAYDKGKKVILISDIYFSKKDIEYLVIDKLDNKHLISNIYISSEYKERKFNKKLFEIVRNDLNINYEEMAHIGDNIHSDYNISNSLNIHTLFYNISKNFQDILDIEEKYIDTTTKKAANLRKMTSLLNPFEKKEEEFYFNYGAIIFGPILWEFSHWLNKLAKKEEIIQINFIMREGKTFEHFFKKFNSKIKTNLLYASRKSIYLATLNENDFNFEKFNFFKFRTFTILDIYDLYKIQLKNIILKDYSNTPIKEINKIYINDRNLLDIFMEDFSTNKEQIKINIKKDKELFLEYLEQIKQNAMIIDFGGGGTVNRNISKVLENKNLRSVLFFMHDFGYKVNTATKTLSFLPYNEKTKSSLELIGRTPEFIEILLNGLEKTTIKYEKIDDKILAITKHPIENSEDFNHLEKIINAFNLGIESFFILTKEYKFKSIINRETIALILGRCIEVPLKDEVEFLGKLHTDEGKGSSKTSQLILEEQKNNLLSLGLEKTYYNLAQNINYKKIDTHWIHGCIASIDNSFLPIIKGFTNIYPNQEYINNIIEILKRNKISKINIYGAGILFVKLKPYLLKENIQIVSVMDTRANLSSFIFEGYEVNSISNVIDENNLYPIIVASVEYSFEISDLIIRYLKSKNLKTKIINDYEGLIEL